MKRPPPRSPLPRRGAPPTPDRKPPTDAQAIADTRVWLEKVVIGLNLCPFARAEHLGGRIGYRVSPAHTTRTLLAHLATELRKLAETDPAVCETLLLIHPCVLTDFLDFNEFLSRAEALVQRLGFEGVFQLASFHPHYRFAGTAVDDITNYTNRAPYPTLHLLREASVARAMAGQTDSKPIVQHNLDLLKRLGHDGWKRLGLPDGRS